MEEKIKSILECPVCRKSELNCEHKFPLINGIPWVFKSTESTLLQWQARTTKLLQMCLVQMAQLDDELLKVDLLPETKERLKILRQAIDENEKFLQKFLSPLWPKSQSEVAPSLAQALEEKVASQQAIESYFNNVFRDWAWRTGENEKSLEAIMGVLPKTFKPKKMVVLGAGSGRLTVDLQTELGIEDAFAVDINPFLLFLFRDLMAGKSHELWEIPISPLSLANTAKKQTLKTSGKTKGSVQFLFADATNLPFKKKSVDCILTPWFIDIIKQDLRQLMRRINNTLEPGGHWINFGPLGFRHFANAENYSVEEIASLLDEEGFKLIKKDITPVPYLSSPLSGLERSEKVLIFLAEKKKESKSAEKYSPLPEWIMDPAKPIKPNRDLKYEISRHHLGFQILSCIDGKNSIHGIAGMVAKHYGVNPAQAQEIVTGFLIEKFED